MSALRQLMHDNSHPPSMRKQGAHPVCSWTMNSGLLYRPSSKKGQRVCKLKKNLQDGEGQAISSTKAHRQPLALDNEWYLSAGPILLPNLPLRQFHRQVQHKVHQAPGVSKKLASPLGARKAAG